MILEIERNGAERFWRIDRVWNKDAVVLANKALDEAVDSDEEAWDAGGLKCQ
jgi:hypothetical protein